jgi:hypothetical protein
VLTTVCGYSRFSLAMLLPSRYRRRIVCRLVAVDQPAGRGAAGVVWDGESAVGRWRARRVELAAECQAFRGALGLAL